MKPYNYGLIYSKRVSWLSIPELESLDSLPDPCKTLLNLDVLVTCSLLLDGAGSGDNWQGPGSGQEEKKPNFLAFASNLPL